MINDWYAEERKATLLLISETKRYGIYDLK